MKYCVKCKTHIKDDEFHAHYARCSGKHKEAEATNEGLSVDERAELELKATELGIKGVISNMKDETLLAKVKEAEATA